MASSEIMASLFGLEFSAHALVMSGVPEGSLPGPVLLLKQLVADAEGKVFISNHRA
jgi:hypothetical protein